MSSPLVFVTGATGFIGASTSLAALEAGYKLRISVRKADQIEKLKGIFAQHADKLEFVVVPDITAPGAFSKALDGVDYIFHLASPLAFSTDKVYMFNAAREGTLNILRDAVNFPNVKKIVITSSIAALIPVGGVPEGGVIKEETGWDLTVDPETDYDVPNNPMANFQIYSASKLLANQASWDFMAVEKPHYALVTIHPSLVYGHNLVQQTAEEVQKSTNGLLFGSIMNGSPTDMPLQCVYVGDVADAHVRALRESVQSGSRYLVSGRSVSWKDVVETVGRLYPALPVKVEAKDDVSVAKTDTSKAEKELGIQWAELETIIKEVFDQQLAYLK